MCAQAATYVKAGRSSGGAADQVRAGHFAKTLGLTIPETLLATADEVIQ
jgi:hypothetical protein